MFVLVILTDLSKPKNIVAIILKQVLNYVHTTTVVLEASPFLKGTRCEEENGPKQIQLNIGPMALTQNAKKQNTD